MRRLLPLLLVVAVLATGCAKVKAQVEPELPSLAPPPPPPRMVAVYEPEVESVPAVEPEPTETTEVPPPRPPRPPGNRNDGATRPEPARAEPAARLITPPPALTLKPPSGTEAKTEASIRGLLDRAGQDLGRVNYAALDPDGRTQYDTARRFRQQAEEALKNRNYVFAGKLADKAATMAAVLVR
jgi:type IV secretory pathway VirB10-like protein